MYEAIKHLVL